MLRFWVDKTFIKITLEVLENTLPKDVVLNVNFPKLLKEDIKGIKVCRQAKSTLGWKNLTKDKHLAEIIIG
jgi:broad specificity polyphosphatase/5'/3'-nucleotidase SurE